MSAEYLRFLKKTLYKHKITSIKVGLFVKNKTLCSNRVYSEVLEIKILNM